LRPSPPGIPSATRECQASWHVPDRRSSYGAAAAASAARVPMNGTSTK